MMFYDKDSKNMLSDLQIIHCSKHSLLIWNMFFILRIFFLKSLLKWKST